MYIHVALCVTPDPLDRILNANLKAAVTACTDFE